MKMPRDRPILALDCSFGGHSVAVADLDAVLAECHHPRQPPSGHIIASIKRLLVRLDITLADIAGVAFGAGPGLFTGIRAACACAQGLAFTQGLRVVAVPTTLALAQLHCRRRALVAYPAYKGHVYLAALEKRRHGWVEVIPPSLRALDNFPPMSGDWELCGRKLHAFRHRMARSVSGSLRARPSHNSSLAGVVGQIGMLRLRAGKAVEPHRASPDYVRHRVAYSKAELAARRARER